MIYHPINPARLFCSVENTATELIEVYNVFVSKVEELDLPSALDAKPLLDVRSPWCYEMVTTLTILLRHSEGQGSMRSVIDKTRSSDWCNSFSRC
jgi:hypothetical protein